MRPASRMPSVPRKFVNSVRSTFFHLASTRAVVGQRFLEQMKCTVDLALARQRERLSREEELPHLRQSDAGRHIEHQLGPVRQIHITMKNGFHPFGPEIDAIEDHAVSYTH